MELFSFSRQLDSFVYQQACIKVQKHPIKRLLIRRTTHRVPFFAMYYVVLSARSAGIASLSAIPEQPSAG
jgi:hypothetical protein